ncbi:putative uncharacterized transposon-derived protein F54H12.3 [Nymphon striatum]|nr:putative uncharacterized transposon-derived protein F54H12.3 [Nymphon striatum]KAG1677000.1 putative uncharacterized transposon-derived protein F54H12.3 [Nymphon striatum]KAG1688552.1 putative uncharacterized transposon-derived protein F54H12.3 [Nymphon striatum]
MNRGKCVICGVTKTQFTKGPSGSGMMNKAINNLPFELHLPGHNFTGPGTRLNKRLTPDLTPKNWSKPINRVDNAAYHHDVCYLKNKDTKIRNKVCDKNMLHEMDGIYNPTLREKLDRSIVSKIIGTKMRFGMGEKKSIDEIWAADLVEMQPFSTYNNGIKYLLTVIDIFSKYGWIVPLKDKTGKSVSKALKTIFADRKPNKIWVDKGREFYSKEVQDLIEIYSTENEEKSCVVERWNRTMKEKMWKYFSANSTRKYIDVLDEMVKNYNNTIHRSIKMTPLEASKKINEKKVLKNLYPLEEICEKPTFSIGDKIRITKKKKTFEKGYTPRWTEEVFFITDIQNTTPVTYKIADYNEEEVKGTFYKQELQKTNQDIFRIEKIIKKKGNKSLVKWLGYPDEFNSWVDNTELFNLD